MLFLPLAGLAVGAAGMYLLDPEQGRRRRAMMREKLNSRSMDLRDAASAGVRDLRNRMRGMAHQTWSSMEAGAVPDRVLVERVRSKIGRHVSHPGAIRVSANDGKVVLQGSVLAGECDALLRTVSHIRGVRGVEDCLQRKPDGQAVSDAATRASNLRMNFLQDDWTPATRAVSGTAGGMLVVFGLRQRGLIGMASSLAGAAMLARAASNRSLSQLARAVSQRTGAERDRQRKRPASARASAASQGSGSAPSATSPTAPSI